MFQVVWDVDNFRSLADHLRDEHLLEPLLRQTSVTARQWQSLSERLEWLNYAIYRHLDVVDLGRRLLACRPDGPLMLTMREDVIRQVASAHRHLGEFVEAEKRGLELYEAVRARGEGSSHDEEADAAVEYVASFYDGHRFGKIVDVLSPWWQYIFDRPKLFRFITRIKVFNTLGRAQVILGLPGWEENFRRSIALQRALDPASVSWTTCYLVHGLLRHRRVGDARVAIDGVGPLEEVTNPYSRASLAHLRAEANRQQGLAGLVACMEERDSWCSGDPPPKHVFAFYHQAVGRQRDRQDRGHRLGMAARLCHEEARANRRSITYLFAVCFDLAAAGADNLCDRWQAARCDLETYLQGDAAFYQHYAAMVAALPPQPDWLAAERVLDQMPYL